MEQGLARLDTAGHPLPVLLESISTVVGRTGGPTDGPSGPSAPPAVATDQTALSPDTTGIEPTAEPRLIAAILFCD
jgi:hypothetical protein